MGGRDVLAVARELVRGSTEAHWRAAAGRAYFAVFLGCRDALIRWGFVLPRLQAHQEVRSRFIFPNDPDLKAIGCYLESLGYLRNRADYQTAAPGPFHNRAASANAARDAKVALDLLDDLEADPTRLTAAVAAIRQRYP